MVNRRKLFIFILSFICSLLYRLLLNCYIIHLDFVFSLLFFIIFATLFLDVFVSFCNIIKKRKLKLHIFLFIGCLSAIISISGFIIGLQIILPTPAIIIVGISFILTFLFPIIGMIEEKK